MGILNLTPDSFFDGGRFEKPDSALRQTEIMLQEGATIIDLGAMSSRPGSDEISEVEEAQRLLPVLEALVAAFPEAIFSVDTYRSNIATEAADRGAAIINDISGGTYDDAMLATVAQLGIPYVMMHLQGKPKTMQEQPEYAHVTEEVMLFFARQLEKLRLLGAKDVVVDPGFGFGKDLAHNYQLLQDLPQFQILDCLVLVGVSRKSMINKVLGTRPETALNGTTAAHTIALMKGANMLRVHDVKEAVQAIKIVGALPSTTV
ncbi:MAG: dihydropteroate synthase [Salibacteraceae bacterium]